MPSDHLILCHPLLLTTSIYPSIRVFSNESVLRIRLPKYWSFRRVLFRSMDVRVFSNTTVQKHQFFCAQLSHPYMTTGKTIALTRWTFVDKVMSLLFNMLSRLVIAFLPRSKCLLISWLQSLSAVVLEPPKNKIWHCFLCFPVYLP